MSDLTDQEIFDSVITREAPTVQAEPDGAAPAARDDQGRFAAPEKIAQAPEPEAQQPAPQPEPEREPSIPPSRLREEAEARRKAEREADELRGQLKVFMERQTQVATPQAPQRQPIDPLSDPEGFTKDIGSQIEQVREQIRQEYRIDRMNGSFDRANRDHGDTFNAALEAFATAANPQRNGGDERLRSQMLESYDPARFVMDWHSRNTLLSEIGSDPNAYRQKIIDDFLANPENHAKLAQVVAPPARPQQPPAQTIKLPPSLSRTPGAAPQGRDQAVSTDEELFNSTISRRR